MSKEGSYCVFFWLVKLIDSAFNLGRNYFYTRIFRRVWICCKRKSDEEVHRCELEISSDEEAFTQEKIKTNIMITIFYKKKLDGCWLDGYIVLM